MECVLGYNRIILGVVINSQATVVVRSVCPGDKALQVNGINEVSRPNDYFQICIRQLKMSFVN